MFVPFREGTQLGRARSRLLRGASEDINFVRRENTLIEGLNLKSLNILTRTVRVSGKFALQSLAFRTCHSPRSRWSRESEKSVLKIRPTDFMDRIVFPRHSLFMMTLSTFQIDDHLSPLAPFRSKRRRNDDKAEEALGIHSLRLVTVVKL